MLAQGRFVITGTSRNRPNSASASTCKTKLRNLQRNACIGPSQASRNLADRALPNQESEFSNLGRRPRPGCERITEGDQTLVNRLSPHA